MLSSKTRRVVKSHKWNKHSNTSQFFARIRDNFDSAVDDLTLLARELDEKQLQEMFTEEKLEKLIKAIMMPGKYSSRVRKIDRSRLFFCGRMMVLWSLTGIERTFENPWAKRYFLEHKEPLLNMLDTIYYEKRPDLIK